MAKTKKMVSAGWRTAALILGVMFLLIISMMVYGVRIAASETKCVDYCFNRGYESFTYDFSTDYCNCYIGTTVKETVRINDLADVGLKIANPASTYCIEQGYNSTISTAPDGSQLGLCIFPNGYVCEEWAYYRGECSP